MPTIIDYMVVRTAMAPTLPESEQKKLPTLTESVKKEMASGWVPFGDMFIQKIRSTERHPVWGHADILLMFQPMVKYAEPEPTNMRYLVLNNNSMRKTRRNRLKN